MSAMYTSSSFTLSQSSTSTTTSQSSPPLTSDIQQLKSFLASNPHLHPNTSQSRALTNSSFAVVQSTHPPPPPPENQSNRPPHSPSTNPSHIRSHPPPSPSSPPPPPPPHSSQSTSNSSSTDSQLFSYPKNTPTPPPPPVGSNNNIEALDHQQTAIPTTQYFSSTSSSTSPTSTSLNFSSSSTVGPSVSSQPPPPPPQQSPLYTASSSTSSNQYLSSYIPNISSSTHYTGIHHPPPPRSLPYSSAPSSPLLSTNANNLLINNTSTNPTSFNSSTFPASHHSIPMFMGSGSNSSIINNQSSSITHSITTTSAITSSSTGVSSSSNYSISNLQNFLKENCLLVDPSSSYLQSSETTSIQNVSNFQLPPFISATTSSHSSSSFSSLLPQNLPFHSNSSAATYNSLNQQTSNSSNISISSHSSNHLTNFRTPRPNYTDHNIQSLLTNESTITTHSNIHNANINNSSGSCISATSFGAYQQQPPPPPSNSIQSGSDSSISWDTESRSNTVQSSISSLPSSSSNRLLVFINGAQNNFVFNENDLKKIFKHYNPLSKLYIYKDRPAAEVSFINSKVASQVQKDLNEINLPKIGILRCIFFPADHNIHSYVAPFNTFLNPSSKTKFIHNQSLSQHSGNSSHHRSAAPEEFNNYKNDYSDYSHLPSQHHSIGLSSLKNTNNTKNNILNNNNAIKSLSSSFSSFQQPFSVTGGQHQLQNDSNDSFYPTDQHINKFARTSTPPSSKAIPSSFPQSKLACWLELIDLFCFEPDFNVTELLLGPYKKNMETIVCETRNLVEVSIQGKPMDSAPFEERLHLLIETEDSQQYRKAVELLEDLLFTIIGKFINYSEINNLSYPNNAGFCRHEYCVDNNGSNQYLGITFDSRNNSQSSNKPPASTPLPIHSASINNPCSTTPPSSTTSLSSSQNHQQLPHHYNNQQQYYYSSMHNQSHHPSGNYLNNNSNYQAHHHRSNSPATSSIQQQHNHPSQHSSSTTNYHNHNSNRRQQQQLILNYNNNSNQVSFPHDSNLTNTSQTYNNSFSHHKERDRRNDSSSKSPSHNVNNNNGTGNQNHNSHTFSNNQLNNSFSGNMSRPYSSSSRGRSSPTPPHQHHHHSSRHSSSSSSRRDTKSKDIDRNFSVREV